MIKATGHGNGKDFVILGLSGENMTRLMSDEPIHIDLAEMGLPPIGIYLVGGKTEADIVAQMEKAGMITKNTQKRDWPDAP